MSRLAQTAQGSAATVDPGSQILILGQVSKPSSKRTENVSFATLSGDLKGGVQDPVVYERFGLNGPRHELKASAEEFEVHSNRANKHMLPRATATMGQRGDFDITLLYTFYIKILIYLLYKFIGFCRIFDSNGYDFRP